MSIKTYGRAFIIGVLSIGIGWLSLVPQTRAAEPKDIENTCPGFVQTLKSTDWQLDGFQKLLEGSRAAVLILARDCPTTPPYLPVQELLKYHKAQNNDFTAHLLGLIYEYGLRVDADPEEARYWYRRFAFDMAGSDEDLLTSARRNIAAFHPHAKSLSDDAIIEAVARGELKSDLLEAEIAAVEKLMAGPAADIVAVSEHLYHGTNGFHQSTPAAKKLLYLASQKGAPEAQYALARAILDRRYYFLPMPRSIQLISVQNYLTAAAKQHYLPAVKELAAFCEKHHEELGGAFATALYLYAKREGAQDVDQHLRRLRQDSINHFDWWVERSIREIEDGRFPLCR